MPAIVNTTFYPNPTGIISATVTIPATTTGNTLVVCAAGQPDKPAGFGGLVITLDGGQVFTDSDLDGNTSGPIAHVCTDIEYLVNCAGGKTSLSISTGGAGPAMWIFEITPSIPDAFGISNLDDAGGTGTMAGIIGPSLTPSASAIYFTVAEGGNYYVQVDISAVGAPWTINPNIIHPTGVVSSASPTAACATYIGTGAQQATFTPGTDPGGFGNYVTNGITFIARRKVTVTFTNTATGPSCPVQLINGNFMDALGNRLAYGTLKLQLTGDTLICTHDGQLVAGRKFNVALDENGNIAGTVNVEPNDLLLPAGTKYRTMAYASDGRQAWARPQYWTVPSTAATLDVGTLVPSA